MLIQIALKQNIANEISLLRQNLSKRKKKYLDGLEQIHQPGFILQQNL